MWSHSLSPSRLATNENFEEKSKKIAVVKSHDPFQKCTYNGQMRAYRLFNLNATNDRARARARSATPKSMRPNKQCPCCSCCAALKCVTRDYLFSICILQFYMCIRGCQKRTRYTDSGRERKICHNRLHMVRISKSRDKRNLCF